ncbi:glycosyl hydrolase [Leptobacterium sp. I13]|uniref:WD40/YVTN/BNR-like repeat-containing protein n=1 Tax=Leptobacterium meishanense TaxID=3128904 RepID=UPI0030ED4824
MKKYILLFLICAGLNFVIAQQEPTSVEDIKYNLESTKELKEESIVKNVPFKNIGPTIMSGRVVDLAVNPEDPTEFYVAYASGGVWHTQNNGTSFTPITDNAPTQNIGDIAIDWKNRTIWVGTGENNASRSSYSGIGILKTTDNGKTWEHMGLMDSHHIGRILINPNNSEEVIIGVTGHLYSPNEERGIYKTVDGGKNWKQTLFVNDETGIIDIAHAPGNFNVMYAASWEKDRKAWNFLGNGNNSGIYKSTDGGETWARASTPESGFPTGEGVGRIGLAVFDENTVFAIHDNQFHREKEEKKKDEDKLVKDDFKTMSVETFLALDNKKLDDYLKTNGFQEKYRAENVKQLVRSESVKPVDLAKYLENANALLFDTPVIGAEVYRTNDGGKTWKKTHEGYIDDLFYSYGYYFAQIAVDPNNVNKLYTGGVPIIRSDDGGKTWKSINQENVHADHHAIWINPNKTGHIINGNDGGVNITYDDGETWIKKNSPSVGQFYAINIDHQKPYNVYGGLQDNGVWKGSHNAREDRSWHQQGQYPWKSIMGGDGMQIQIDARNPNIVYTGYQFGNYFRLDLGSGKRKYIQPKHELGESPYRFNWQTPILLSPHNQDILYFGGNKLMRSLNQGDDWTAISGDLTKGGKKGNVAYGTITTISESPFEFGLIYVGTDDGLVHVTKNGGNTWENISDAFHEDLWVSRVVASKHKKGRVYATLNGYRWDDFTSYVYRSDDYGKTWGDLHRNLPTSPVNVIIEDPENENIIYVGTDNSVYVSFTGGKKWEAFDNGLTNAAVHDLVIQPEEKHLLVGTHGRSIYKADIAPLQYYNYELSRKAIHIFEIDAVRHSGRWGERWSTWSDYNEPDIEIAFYTFQKGTFEVKVMSEDGIEMNSFQTVADKGFNYTSYDLTMAMKGKKAYEKKHKDTSLKKASNGKYYLPKGKYTIAFSGNEGVAKREIEIK